MPAASELERFLGGSVCALQPRSLGRVRDVSRVGGLHAGRRALAARRRARGHRGQWAH